MQYLLVRSADRSSGSNSPSDCAITVPQPIALPQGAKLKLVHASVPQTWYNVESGINDKCYYTVAPTEYEVQLTPGNYAAEELGENIAALMTAEGPVTFTSEYDPNSFQFTFTASSGSFRFKFAGESDSCCALIGFEAENTGYATEQVGTLVPRLSEEYGYLQIQELAPANIQTTIYSVPNSTYVLQIGDGGTYSEFLSDWEQVATASVSVLQSLHCKLMRADGRLLDLHGGEWSIVLQLK